MYTELKSLLNTGFHLRGLETASKMCLDNARAGQFRAAFFVLSCIF